MKPVLYFVYNVDLTPKALLKDFIHRSVHPETYPCKLCDVTYGRFLKKKVWQNYLKTLPVKSRFYTRDVFKKKFPVLENEPAPFVVYKNPQGDFSRVVSHEDFMQVHHLSHLSNLLEKKLAHLAL